jgi:hypothetical protein
MEYTTMVISLMGIVATVVSAITEMTKEIGFLAKTPTAIQVIVLSVVMWVVIYAAGISLGEFKFMWFSFVAVLIVGLMNAYVAMYGWEKLQELFNRHKKGE